MQETLVSIQSCVAKTPDGLSRHQLKSLRVITIYMTTKTEDPSPQRIAEYELKYMELMRGGGHMMDFIGLQNHYQDVIQFKNRTGNQPRS